MDNELRKRDGLLRFAMTVALCLLVWNEVDGCRLDVPNIPRQLFDEILAIDGGSKDGTIEYLLAQGIPVVHQTGHGLNAAYWQAVLTTSCDAVVFYFPKGTIHPTALVNFRPYLEAGCDLIVAGRTLAGARNEEDNQILKPRKWLVMILGFIVALRWRREGTRIRDVLHGVRAMSVEGFRRMNPSRSGITIDLETTVRSYRLHLVRAEFAVKEVVRPFGKSHFRVVPTGMKLLRWLLRELVQPQRDGP